MSKTKIRKSTLDWKRVETSVLMALFFSIPIWPRATTLLIGFYVLIILVTINKQHFSNFLIHKEFVIYVLLYLLLVVGLSYSMDFDSGISKIQTQASLLVIPLFLGGKKLSENERTTCIDLFVLGLLVTVLLCFLHGLYRFFTLNSVYVLDEFSRKNNIFYYTEFSGFLDLHPTYFSLYLGLAIFYLIYTYRKKSRYILMPKGLLIAIFFIALFFTSSKAGIFSFVLIVSAYLIYQSLRRKSKMNFLMLTAVAAGTVLMFLINPLLYSRSFQGLSSVDRVLFQNENTNESTGIRLNLWRLSMEVSKKALLLGHGTGSVQKILNENCLTHNSFSTCEGLRNKNSHNQYLNFTVSNGLIFTILFIGVLLFGFVRAIRKGDGIFVFFMFFMAVNFFFESLLQREKGIVFFTLFAVMLTISQGTTAKE